MARRDETPRDLLFGLLALHIGLIDQDQLLAAFGDWSRARGKTLAEILVERGSIDAESRVLLEGMAQKQLMVHGGDTEKSLAAVAAGPSTRERLAAIGDADLTSSVAFLGSQAPSPDDTVSMSVGTSTSDGQRFRVLRPHARGGLGAVFVALDGELNREVALKQILDHHADDPVSRTRFLIEAEITGGLEHPGIVPVYGLGHYDDGRPYYAMRFIRGDSLRRAIADFHADEALRRDPGQRSLALRKLLRRFVNVCNAIDYAHGRGILHRDLKPGNVIVGRHGETLVVDWGLAKPMGKAEPASASDERTLIPSSSSGSAETLPGSAIGTPAYMSPEQAAGDLEKLGPRSDVYSLGATLYCLLTGKAPFEESDVGTILREVQRGAFPPPRRVDPSIDQALEAVCLKAMATRPEDRHASARALAEDVERWGADEPVSAWREPASVRARRWMRRNRTAVTAASAAVLMAVVGLAGVLAVQSRANGILRDKNLELDRANAREVAANSGLREANERVSRANAKLEAQNLELDRANRLKDEANARLLEANGRVQARFELAREAIRSFQQGVNEDDMLRGEELKGLRDKLLRSAAGFYQKLEGLLQGQADRNSRAVLAQSYFELGELTEKIGVQPEALAVYRKALAIRRELAGSPEADPGSKLDLARSLIATSSLAEATGDDAGALSAAEEARGLAEPLATGPGATDAARDVLGTGHQRIGTLLENTGKMTEALESFRRALLIREGLCRDNPAVNEFRGRLADSHSDIGGVLSAIGRAAEAMESYRAALVIREGLVRDNPAVTEFRNSLALSLINSGYQSSAAGRKAEALESYGRALAIYEGLSRDHPAVTDFRRYLAICHNNIGHVRLAIGRTAEAIESYGRALAIQRKLADDNPAVRVYRNNLAFFLNNLANHQAAIGRTAEALASWDEAIAIQRKLADDNPEIQYYRNNLATSHTNSADLLRSIGRIDEARAGYDRAIAIRDKLVEANPKVTMYRSHLAYSLRKLGMLRAASGDIAGAVAAARRAVELYEGLTNRSGYTWYEGACARSALAGLAGRDGSGISAEGAQPEADRAMAALRRAVEAGYRSVAEFRAEEAFAPLRSRPDFRLLMMDLAFPARPFADGSAGR